MKSIATLTLAVLASFVLGQGGPPPGGLGGPPRGGGPATGVPGGGGPAARGGGASTRSSSTRTPTETMRILGLKAVQNDLGLTLAQWNALCALARSGPGATLTEDAAFAAVAKILTEAQTTRLRELLVQDMGYGALALSGVRAELDLTDEQRTTIAALTANLEIARKAVDRGTTLVEMEKNARAALAKILTTAQDAKLRSLAGRTLK